MAKVKLLTYTPEPERLVAAAARICYADELPENLFAGMTDEEITKLLERLTRDEHFSPFEHASFTFAVSGVSRTFSHELVRHRIASYTQRSQRYVNESSFDYILPESIKNKDERVYVDAVAAARMAYHKLLAAGVPKEDAREILPNATHTQLIVTANARSLRNLFKLRCCKRASWEIRGVAWEMLEQVKKVAPRLFIGAGPQCICKNPTKACMECEGD